MARSGNPFSAGRINTEGCLLLIQYNLDRRKFPFDMLKRLWHQVCMNRLDNALTQCQPSAPPARSITSAKAAHINGFRTMSPHSRYKNSAGSFRQDSHCNDRTFPQSGPLSTVLSTRFNPLIDEEVNKKQILLPAIQHRSCRVSLQERLTISQTGPHRGVVGELGMTQRSLLRVVACIDRP